MNDNYPPGFNSWELDGDEVALPEEEDLMDDDSDLDEPLIDPTDEELLNEETIL